MSDRSRSDPNPDDSEARGVWESILAEGEHILWQGQPAPGLFLRASDLFQIASGLVLIAGGTILATIDRNGGSLGFLVLILLVKGGWNAFSPLLAGAFMRRYSFYTLTNRRAFIGHNLPLLGRGLKSWPVIGPNAQLELLDHGGAEGTVLFGTTTPPWYSRHRNDVPVGFERIADAARVFALMSDLQRTPI